MDAQITLTEAEVNAVVALHQANIDALKKEIDKLNLQIAASANRIAELKLEDVRYNSSMPLWKKVQHVLSVNKSILTTKEIARSIALIEGNDPLDVRDMVSAISATLKPKIDKQDTFAREDIGGEHYYGLIEWMDSDGEFKTEYTNMY